jgi:hypothetical protein
MSASVPQATVAAGGKNHDNGKFFLDSVGGASLPAIRTR